MKDSLYLGASDVQSMPKHRQIRNLLLDAITGGTFAIGDCIPAQTELADYYKVSHSTIREAVALLVQEGYLERIHGKGTFVKRNKPVPTTIAFILPTVFSGGLAEQYPGHDIGPRYLRAVESEVKQHSANLFILLDNNDPDMERFNINAVIDQRVDGVIIDYFGNRQNLDCIKRLQDSGIPFVMIDNILDGLDVDCVTTDNFGGAYSAVKQLVSLGAEKVYHPYDQVDNKPCKDRLQGYLKAMDECSVEPCLWELDQHDIIGNIRKLCVEMADESEKSKVAVFTRDALQLSVFWNVLCENSTPDGRILLSCFDEPYIQFPGNVTVVKVLQPLEEIGRRSVQIVMEKLKGSKERYKIVLDPDVRVINGPNTGKE